MSTCFQTNREQRLFLFSYMFQPGWWLVLDQNVAEIVTVDTWATEIPLVLSLDLCFRAAFLGGEFAGRVAQ